VKTVYYHHYFLILKRFVMKNLLVAILFLSIGVWSCSTNAEKGKQEQSVTQPAVPTVSEVKKDTTQALVYVCPMDPEIKGKKGDKCSKCGMKLVHKD
jgi:Heavy metal binding domain